ncbi:hypothetical protein RRG08_013858 [Elysia crispata]|uniref:Uncharacterized protein n=1 Tax=Elysia crispata TaxID=231223 RepID=A0AAE1D0H5_9GAST|nr:hypothetical protein RRG08_013858 [Elysia crispata]
MFKTFMANSELKPGPITLNSGRSENPAKYEVEAGQLRPAPVSSGEGPIPTVEGRPSPRYRGKEVYRKETSRVHGPKTLRQYPQLLFEGLFFLLSRCSQQQPPPLNPQVFTLCAAVTTTCDSTSTARTLRPLSSTPAFLPPAPPTISRATAAAPATGIFTTRQQPHLLTTLQS